MLAVMLFAIFFVIALAGVPLMYGLIATTLGVIAIANLGYPPEAIMLPFIGGVEPYILIAIPLFLFAGEVLAKGGSGKRIVNFTQSILGFLPGGLGVVTVVSCLLFGGISGSAIADTAAIGSLVIPMMVEKGYPRGFTAALLAVAGTLALLMPLSIPFLVYAFVSDISMRELSMSGLVPAAISALGLIVICMIFGIKSGCDKGGKFSSLGEIWKAFKDAGFALLMPVIIVGGIWTGTFTPTEAAAVAVVFGLFISLFVYKDITFKEVPKLLFDAFKTSSTVMLVIGATGCLAWLITAQDVAAQIAQWVGTVAKEPWMFLIMVNISLFILGVFIEPLPAMMLSAPLFIPLAKTFGIDMVHFGVIFVGNLAIALYTPPVGGTLFVSAKLAKAGIGDISKRLIPMMALMLIVIIIVTYIPASTSVLRNIMAK